jgi:hypothetical protein
LADLSRTERIKSKLEAVVSSMPRKHISPTPTQSFKSPSELGSFEDSAGFAKLSTDVLTITLVRREPPGECSLCYGMASV